MIAPSKPTVRSIDGKWCVFYVVEHEDGRKFLRIQGCSSWSSALLAVRNIYAKALVRRLGK